jgi:hypothetical protein
MKIAIPKNRPVAKTKAKPLGARAFAAITAVEGLKLGKASKQRLHTLTQDDSLTPEERRAEVLKAYMDLSRRHGR